MDQSFVSSMQIKVSFVLSSKSMPLSEKPIKVKTVT